jgi:hypothetical protein
MKQQIICACFASALLMGCGSQEGSPPVAGTTTTTNTAAPAPAGGGNAIQIEDYTFRISNSVEGQKAHIDLFLTKGAANDHVPGANIELTLTAPDGHTETVNMKEDAPNKHYAGTATMDHTGEYQVAARTSVEGKTFTPRFTITNAK